MCNTDEYDNLCGYRAPGNGMIIAALSNGLRKSDGSGLICDKVVVGKPNPEIVELIRN